MISLKCVHSLCGLSHPVHLKTRVIAATFPHQSIVLNLSVTHDSLIIQVSTEQFCSMNTCEYIYRPISLEIDRNKHIYSHFNRLEIMDDKTPQYLSAALLSGVILHTINVSLRRIKAKLTCVLPFEPMPCTVNC